MCAVTQLLSITSRICFCGSTFPFVRNEMRITRLWRIIINCLKKRRNQRRIWTEQNCVISRLEWPVRQVQPQCVHTFVQLRPMKVDIPAISSLATKAHRDTRCMINGMCECMNTFSSFVSRLGLIFIELCNFELVQLSTPTLIPLLFFDEDESV